MLLNYFILCCIVYLYRADPMKLPRYVIESDMKPAIFGSYSYDVVQGIFVLQKTNSSTTEMSLNDIIFNKTSSSTLYDKNFRKHVKVTESVKTIDWWTRARLFLKNSTRKLLSTTSKVN